MQYCAQVPHDILSLLSAQLLPLHDGHKSSHNSKWRCSGGRNTKKGGKGGLRVETGTIIVIGGGAMRAVGRCTVHHADVCKIASLKVAETRLYNVALSIVCQPRSRVLASLVTKIGKSLLLENENESGFCNEGQKFDMSAYVSSGHLYFRSNLFESMKRAAEFRATLFLAAACA